MVPARITVVTLGARDHPRLREFYVGLGWEATIDMEGFAALRTAGAVLALFDAGQLAGESTRPAPEPGQGGRGFTLAINVDRAEEVDATIDAARAAGATVVTEPVQQDWGGRSGYFTDPEDNAWEVAWVPPGNQMAALLRHASGRD